MAGGRSRSPSTGSPTSSDDHEVDFPGAAGGCGPYPSYPSIRRRGSYRAIAAPPPPTRSAAPAVAGFFWDALSDVDPHHYLDSCFLCKKHLNGNRDIFMYRGDTPFCSEECRQQQIEVDEGQEKKWKRVTQETQHNSGGATSPPKSEKLHVRAAGTAVAG